MDYRKRYTYEDGKRVININKFKSDCPTLWDKMAWKHDNNDVDDTYDTYYMLMNHINENFNEEELDDNELKKLHDSYKSIPHNLLRCNYNEKYRYFYKCSNKEFNNYLNEFKDEVKNDSSLDNFKREDIYLIGLCHLSLYIQERLDDLKPLLKPTMTTLEYLKKKVTCECGAVVSYVHKKRHFESIGHLRFLAKQLPEFADPISFSSEQHAEPCSPPQPQ